MFTAADIWGYNSPWNICKSWRRQNILTFVLFNSKCENEIQLTMAISENIENKSFEICERDRSNKGSFIDRVKASFYGCILRPGKNSSLETKRKKHESFSRSACFPSSHWKIFKSPFCKQYTLHKRNKVTLRVLSKIKKHK